MARTRVAFAIALFLIPATVLAQRATTGTVTGKVVDTSGAVLPGVTIALQSAEVLGQFSAITGADGTYRVGNLPPATYDVRAELSGFQTVIQKVIVRLNAVTDVGFTLAVGSVAEPVTVIGESPIVDPERAGLSVNIHNQALTSVPVTTNRRFQDAWLVVPGVAINPATQELTGSERRTSLDGADVTDPYGRRHLRRESELRRHSGRGDQSARRRGRRWLEHGRPVHEHRHQERREPVSRVGRVLRHSSKLQHRQRPGDSG